MRRGRLDGCAGGGLPGRWVRNSAEAAILVPCGVTRRHRTLLRDPCPALSRKGRGSRRGSLMDAAGGGWTMVRN